MVESIEKKYLASQPTREGGRGKKRTKAKNAYKIDTQQISSHTARRCHFVTPFTAHDVRTICITGTCRWIEGNVVKVSESATALLWKTHTKHNWLIAHLNRDGVHATTARQHHTCREITTQLQSVPADMHCWRGDKSENNGKTHTNSKHKSWRTKTRESDEKQQQSNQQHTYLASMLTAQRASV